MATCVRCGTALLPAATVCAACCQPVAGAADPVVMTSPAMPAALPPAMPPAGPPAVPEAAALVPPPPPPAAAEQTPQAPEPPAAAEQSRESPKLPAEQAAADATAPPLNTLQIPTQRDAFFNPRHVSKAPPPPNPYLAAERRQYALLKEGQISV
ncbi:MAG TPA: hypothetical protein VHE57_00255 [Mycobacteriales bacterium]|nr:hypothetical protein [Mycobacteriales bacterium]